ncbi:avidin/streptavidin family protein [Emticicia sp. 21SJ11W-3]|uniref:avidin/streptavidin family protein n=1 Tax=Emticicia sp. 21SJ11W-3 TaxID=2916755 RepID=UPI00209F5EC0|nr:avidin/streptavidin family protein [Emticicia sp. 21SJ11W-3]UTA68508.1 hypothetical protein MB380_01570 [Emticicia sp. 21SJ11W-3]
MNKISSGKWISRGGATLKIRVTGNRVIGTYSTSNGRPKSSEQFFVNGLINNELIGFTVAFLHEKEYNSLYNNENYHSLTTWCGRYEKRIKNYETKQEEDCIRAVWNYAKMFADKANTEPIDSASVFHVGQVEFFWEGQLTKEEEALINSIARTNS